MRIGAVVSLHVHVVSALSPEIGELLGFRDRLRADPALREAYVARNRSILAAGIVDGASYADATGSFIRAALADLRPDPDRRDAAGD